MRFFKSLTLSSCQRKAFSTKVSVDIKDKQLNVAYADGKRTSFLFLWLRDHSKAPGHYEERTKQRLLQIKNLDLDIVPESVTCDEAAVSIQWPDKTVSKYSFDWLRANSHEPNISNEKCLQIKEEYWDASLAERLPTVNFENVMKSESGLADYLRLIERYGLCFIDKVPVSPEDTEKLANRIAFIRETHYGKFWDFTSNLAHNDLAYSTSYLGGHTDTTYFTDPIGLQLFHVLHHKNGTGGESLYVDAFAVAQQMRKLYPKEYNVLRSTPISSRAAGDVDVFIEPTPHCQYLFNHDKLTGSLYQVRFNNEDRSVINHLRHSELVAYYDALKKWDALLRKPENELWVKNVPGRAVIVNNWRVLHGRAAFSGNRRLCGAYINYDDYKSRVKCVLYKGKAKEYL